MTIRIRPYRGTKQWEYEINVRMANGKTYTERRRSSGTTRSAAQRMAEQRERYLIDHGPPTPKDKQVPTLSDFKQTYLDHLETERRKHSYVQLQEYIYRVWLIPLFGKKRLDEITTADVAKLKKAMTERKPKTVNNALLTLRRVLATAHDPFEFIQAVPKVKLLKQANTQERPFHEPEDLEALITAAGEIDPRIELVVLLGAEAGLRVGEILALEYGDVIFKRGYLLIERAVYDGVIDTPKGGKGRRVPMTHRLQAALQRHRHLKGPYVLLNDDNERMTYRVVSKWLAKAERRAGLADARGSVHKLRHTFCSHLAMRGAAPMSIKELAGHADIKTTMGYAHLSPSAGASAIDLLNASREAPEKPSHKVIK